MCSEKHLDIKQYYKLYTISNFCVNEDETKLVYNSNSKGRFNLWSIDLPSSTPNKLTSYNHVSPFIKIDPKNNYIIAGYDNKGGHCYKLYSIPMEGGDPTPIVDCEEDNRFFLTQVSEDGEKIYYSTTKGNPYFLNIYSYNIDTKEEELLVKGDETTTQLLQVSPSGKSFVYMKAYSNSFIACSVQSGNEIIPITPDPSLMHSSSNINYANENLIYFVTNFKEDFSYVASFNIETLKFEKVTSIKNNNVTNLRYNEKENSLYIVTENGVIDSLYKYSLDSETLESLSYPADVIQQLEVAKSGNIYILGKSSTGAPNIYCKKGADEWTNLTGNEIIDLPEETLVDPEIVSYSSFDEYNIEALLYKAKPDVANGHTIFWIHGGHQDIERKSYRSFFQYLLANGYNVFTPNFRGSYGYGPNFIKSIEKDWGEGPRLDCLGGIRWLISENVSEKGKIFVMGESYGGYMSLLLASRHADYIAGAVDFFGPSNLVSFINAIPEETRHVAKKLIGDPVLDEDKLVQDSPITYIDTLTKPLFVVQGANDQRILMSETDKMVDILEENEVAVDYLVLADDAHGFSNKENELEVYRQVLDFFNNNIEK